MTTHYLVFDDRVYFGSCEHFFHAMWGYLLPALNEILNVPSSLGRGKRSRFWFRTCGPIMDRVIHEVASLLGLEYRVLVNLAEADGREAHRILVPRWDIELMALDRLGALAFCANRDEWRDLSNLLRQLSVNRDRLASEITRVRDLLLSQVGEPIEPEMAQYNDRYLILARSPQPRFYDHDGPAEIKGYGTGRRELLGIAEAIAELRRERVPVTRVEPGRLSLAEQIRAFRTSRGIVGIVGAEFANALWLRAGTIMVRINAAEATRVTPMVSVLADLLGLRLHELPTDEGSRPHLNALVLRRYLTAD